MYTTLGRIYLVSNNNVIMYLVTGGRLHYYSPTRPCFVHSSSGLNHSMSSGLKNMYLTLAVRFLTCGTRKIVGKKK